MAQNSSQFTAKIAENYENFLAPAFFISTSKELVSRLMGKPGKILELASGTGQVTRRLAEKFQNAEIIATDINPGMLEVAKKKVTSSNVKWGVVDAQETPYGESEFDIVVCQFGVMFFPNKLKALKEAYRVLKQGGTILFNTWDSLEHNSMSRITDETLRHIFPDDPPPFFHIPYSMYDIEEMMTLMKDAGFRNITIENIKLEGFSDSVESAVTALTEGNPVYMQIVERDESMLPALKERLAKAFTKEFGTGAFKVPLSEFVVTASK